MTLSTNPFTSVMLTGLPSPQVIEPLDFETIRNTMLADLATLAPETAGLGPSDPLVKLIDLFAYRELLLRARFNEIARAIMPALATGADLDQLAALLGVKRFEAETDESLRLRVVNAPEGWSGAGPVGAYLARATAAHADIAFVSVSSPAPAFVTIAVQSKSNDGVAPQAVLAAVSSAVSADSARPIADRVSVVAADMISLDVTAQLRTYPDVPAATTIAAAEASLRAWFTTNGRLGHDVTTDALIAALRVPGISKVTLIAPAQDLALTETQAGRLGLVVVTHSGVGG